MRYHLTSQPLNCEANMRVTHSLVSIRCKTACRACSKHDIYEPEALATTLNGRASQQQAVAYACTQQQESAARGSASSSSSNSSSNYGSNSRRQLMVHSTLAPLLVQFVIGSDDATTVVNSVLSAYGEPDSVALQRWLAGKSFFLNCRLPTLKASSGFRLYDEFEDEFYFEYPKSWVARPNSMRRGVYISDFQTADKLTVEDVEVPADGDIGTAAVAAAVAPGGGRLQDDRLGLPAQRLIKTTSTNVDGQDFLYLEFPSETITRSGYNIRRKNFAAATVKRGRLYIIAASARSDQFNEEKKQLLQHIVQSFRVR